jgi:hypothetical protein
MVRRGHAESTNRTTGVRITVSTADVPVTVQQIADGRRPLRRGQLDLRIADGRLRQSAIVFVLDAILAELLRRLFRLLRFQRRLVGEFRRFQQLTRRRSIRHAFHWGFQRRRRFRARYAFAFGLTFVFQRLLRRLFRQSKRWRLQRRRLVRRKFGRLAVRWRRQPGRRRFAVGRRCGWRLAVGGWRRSRR